MRHARGLNALLPRIRASAGALHPLWRLRSATGGWSARSRRSSAGQGAAVRLPDVRTVRAELHRHVLPDELPEEAAQRSVRRRARERSLRSHARDALRLGAGLRGRERIPGGIDKHCGKCSTRSTGGCRAAPPGCGWCASDRAALGDAAVMFEDEPVPGYPLPILPGHTSPGPLRARAARRAVRSDDRARAAGFRRPARTSTSARACFDGYVDADQRDRRQRRQLPHVEPGGVRAAHARRLRAGDADLLPRQEPDRDPGRHPRRRGHGRVQHAVPDRRWRAGGRSSAGPAGVRSRLRCRCSRSRACCATSTSSRAAARSAPRRACCSAPARIRWRRRSNCARCAWRRKSPPARSSSRRSTCYDLARLRAFMRGVEDLGLLDQVFLLIGVGPMQHRQGGRVDARARARRAHPRRRSSSAWPAPQDQAREGRNSASSSSRRSAPSGRARRARHGLPPGRDGRRDHYQAPACSTAACPGTRRAISESTQTGKHHDRYRSQFRNPRGRDRIRPPVRDHRRAHQSDRTQDPGRRNGRRRLQPRRGRRPRTGGGRRPHARRQCRHSARRRAGDPRAKAVQLVQSITDVPLSIDSSIVAALEAGLAVYKGKALVNSVTGEEERLESVLPLIKKYGAAVVAISNDETGISEDPDVRFEVAKRIVHRAPITAFRSRTSWSIRWSCRSAPSTAPRVQVMHLLHRLKNELKVNTTCGASNISFGLPRRNGINAAFLTMAIGSGMTSAITNPLHPEVVEAVLGADVMMGHDPDCARWIRSSASRRRPAPPRATAGPRSPRGRPPAAADAQQSERAWPTADALVVFTPVRQARTLRARHARCCQAARTLGVDIDSVCGGRALCTRCQVLVTEGEFAKHDVQLARREHLSAAVGARAAATRIASCWRPAAGCPARRACRATWWWTCRPTARCTARWCARPPRRATSSSTRCHAALRRGRRARHARSRAATCSGSPTRCSASGSSRRWRAICGCCRSLQAALRAGRLEGHGRGARRARGSSSVWPGLHEKVYGLAVDVGSTTIAAHLCDLTTGEIVAAAGADESADPLRRRPDEPRVVRR